MLNTNNVIISYVDAMPKGMYTCRAIHKPTNKKAYENGRDKDLLLQQTIEKLSNEVAACNAKNPREYVHHSKLTRPDQDNPYRSWCPKCLDGLLMMQRDRKTMELLTVDSCLLCGQEYEYTDLKETGLQ